MTDEEIKNTVAAYIIGGHESDNADCLHEMDVLQDDGEQDTLKRAYEFYSTATATATWGDE